MSVATMTRMQPQRTLLIVAAILVVAGVAAVILRGGENHLENARAELANDEAFRGATSAGEALLRASVELQRAGEACEGDGAPAACARLFTAAAVARVSSVDLLRCRRPDIFAFRNGFRDHLSALAAGAPSEPPGPPNCD